MRLIGIVTIAALLAGCGGGVSRFDAPGGRVMKLSSGPISRACMDSDRKARNTQLCGCIQTVADQDLSGRDQRMAVGFYKDPHRAQEVRQSDRPSDEEFWKRYSGFAQKSEQLCRGYSS